MSDLGNKQVFSKNLQTIMSQKQITRRQICSDLGFVYSTFSDWYNGKKYPRIDKIEMMANYFGINKSDLIEDRSTEIPPSLADMLDEICETHNCDEKDREILEKYIKLNKSEREAVKKFIRVLIDSGADDAESQK